MNTFVYGQIKADHLHTQTINGIFADISKTHKRRTYIEVSFLGFFPVALQRHTVFRYLDGLNSAIVTAVLYTLDRCVAAWPAAAADPTPLVICTRYLVISLPGRPPIKSS